MADFKELKDEELEKVNGGGEPLATGTIRKNSLGVEFEILEYAGKDYGLDWYRARVHSVPDAVKDYYKVGDECCLHSGLVL